MDDKIVLSDEWGNQLEMFLVSETRINSETYLLVAEDDSEDTTAYILKDISGDEDEVATYELLNDDREINYIGEIFSELLEDTKLII